MGGFFRLGPWSQCFVARSVGTWKTCQGYYYICRHAESVDLPDSPRRLRNDRNEQQNSAGAFRDCCCFWCFIFIGAAGCCWCFWSRTRTGSSGRVSIPVPRWASVRRRTASALWQDYGVPCQDAKDAVGAMQGAFKLQDHMLLHAACMFRLPYCRRVWGVSGRVWGVSGRPVRYPGF